MLLGIVLIIALFFLWKLFVGGWLFKGILFIAGWFGLYTYLHSTVDGANTIAMTVNGNQISWAVLVPTVICVLCLFCSKGDS